MQGFFYLLILSVPTFSFSKSIYFSVNELNLSKTSSIQNYENRKVSLKGFLYRTKNNRWLLSSEPHLKSCCVGSKNKYFDQIYLSNFPPPQVTPLQGKVYKLIGILKKHKENNLPFFTLEEIEIINKKGKLFFLFIPLLAFLFYIIRVVFLKTNPRKT